MTWKPLALLILVPLVTGCVAAPDTNPENDKHAGPEAVEQRKGAQPVEDAATNAMKGDSDPNATTGKSGPSQVYRGTWKVGGGAPGGCYGALIVLPTLEIGDGIWFDAFRVDSATIGLPFEVYFVEPVPGPHGPWAGITFFDAAGDPVGDKRFGARQGIAAGVVPQDSAGAALWSCESGPMTAAYRAG